MSSSRGRRVWIGRPLIRLSFRNELTNAAFRYALVRLRDAGEAVRVLPWRGAERGRLMTRFAASSPITEPSCDGGGVPRLEQVGVPDRRPVADDRSAPRLFAGQIQLGDITQSSSAVPKGTRLGYRSSSRLRLVAATGRPSSASTG